mgnify:CR=1 FL=1
MALPESTTELTQRLHAAILALEPDLDLPALPQAEDPQAAAELLGLLTAYTDELLRRQDDALIMHTVSTYNHVSGHTDSPPDKRTPMYERFADRIRFTGLALTPVGGRGVVMMANGCLVAAYEAALLGAEFDPELMHPDRLIPEDTRQRMNKRLISAQQYMEKSREGIAGLAGYPEVPTAKDGQVLESDDERITRIVDMGASVLVEYAFSTPDGPVRSRGQALLDEVTELIGLTAEERGELLVRMVEADVDRAEAQTLHAPPSPED